MDEKYDLIIFGALGDLATRKLCPALYHLEYYKLLPDDFCIIALAMEPRDTADFSDNLKQKMRPFVYPTYWSDERWKKFSSRFIYVDLDFLISEQYVKIQNILSNDRVNIFYLATPPSLFKTICRELGNYDCLNATSRVVLEKPIGHDLESCRQVNELVAGYFREDNIYRIDHYLGKETVQNLLVLRFANRFINSQWDQTCIDHVQITVAETVGIEGRWSYYDSVGQLRDMVQNHLLQLLCLVAMEPPNSMTAECIREEKIKVLRALRKIDDKCVNENSVRARYTAGSHNGTTVPGYLEEEGCNNPTSATETFVAIRAFIDNWRWAGVPFYLRTGKRMPEKVTEVVITYKDLPHNIFSSEKNVSNQLVIRLQPNEGIEMRMVAKVHSLRNKMALASRTLNLDFLGSSGMDRIPDAYERLLLDVIRADQSLFVGREEVQESWRWCDALINAWNSQQTEVNSYSAGTPGPAEADWLIQRDGKSWRT